MIGSKQGTIIGDESAAQIAIVSCELIGIFINLSLILVRNKLGDKAGVQLGKYLRDILSNGQLKMLQLDLSNKSISLYGFSGILNSIRLIEGKLSNFSLNLAGYKLDDKAGLELGNTLNGNFRQQSI